jgi:hypothetical protein
MDQLDVRNPWEEFSDEWSDIGLTAKEQRLF